MAGGDDGNGGDSIARPLARVLRLLQDVTQEAPGPAAALPTGTAYALAERCKWLVLLTLGVTIAWIALDCVERCSARHKVDTEALLLR
eukprot:3024303-Prymnesium_polylepis.2